MSPKLPVVSAKKFIRALRGLFPNVHFGQFHTDAAAPCSKILKIALLFLRFLNVGSLTSVQNSSKDTFGNRPLRRAGFDVDRQKGSHVVLVHREKALRLVVPVHNRDLKRGLLAGLLHRAGISIEEFFRLLKP